MARSPIEYTLAQLHRQATERMIREVYGFIVPEVGRPNKRLPRTAAHIIASNKADRTD